MNNKRGNLLTEETVKLIIGVICLTLLAFLLFQIYNSYSNNKEMEQAKASLKHITDEINLMKVGETKEVMIYNPSGTFRVDYWVIISFLKTESPELCSNQNWENCLCICKNVYATTTTLLGKTQAEKCDEKGTCVEYNYDSKVPLIKLLDLPANLVVKKTETKKLEIKRKIV